MWNHNPWCYVLLPHCTPFIDPTDVAVTSVRSSSGGSKLYSSHRSVLFYFLTAPPFDLSVVDPSFTLHSAVLCFTSSLLHQPHSRSSHLRLISLWWIRALLLTAHCIDTIDELEGGARKMGEREGAYVRVFVSPSLSH